MQSFASGDEFYVRLHDENNYTIIQSQDDGYYYYAQSIDNKVIPSIYRADQFIPQGLPLNRSVKIPKDEYMERRNKFRIETEERDAPTTGTINNINIFIRFADEEEFITPRLVMDEFFNKSEGPSLSHYYDEVSYSQLEVITHHFPVCDLSTNLSYQDQYPRSYYQLYNATTNPDGYTDGNRRIREHTLLKNAIEFVASEVPNYLDVDGNDDGYVDNVSFLISGSPDGWSELLWPHRWSLYTYNAYINGSMVRDYNFNLSMGGYFTVGVLCHEFFHSLGAPDLYHYEDNFSPTPVGPWDVMSQSAYIPPYMGAWMKHKYGNWIDCPIIDMGTYSLMPLQSNENSCFRIDSPNSAYEFFVLEYRKQEGLYEIGLPGNDSGILVYRITSYLNGNAGGPPDEVYVYRPGGTTTVGGNIYDAIFSEETGRTAINDFTDPSSFLYGDEPGELWIKDIGSPGDTIEFTYSDECDEEEVQLLGVCYSIENTVYLDLSNSGLTADLPVEICNLANLTYLDLSNNNLTGQIPECIGTLNNLTDLLLNHNQLFGEIPNSICDLSIDWNTESFNIIHNGFCEPYPVCIEEYMGDQDCNPYPNCYDGYTGINGYCYYQSDLDVLQEFIDVSSAINIEMDNNWNEVIEPLELGEQTWFAGRLTELDCYWFDYEAAPGEDFIKSCNVSEIPASIANLTDLVALDLSYNHLTYLPESICSIYQNLVYFNVEYNRLCPPYTDYPECITVEDLGVQDTWFCDPVVHLSITNVDTLNGTLDIYMENEIDVYGFQITIYGINLTGAYGGSSELNEFLVDTSSEFVLGFDIGGGSIPAGEGILCSISFEDYAGGEICLPVILDGNPSYHSPILSDVNGVQVSASVGDCYSPYSDSYGCLDISACNYNPEATIDDGNCIYPDLGDVNCDFELNILDVVTLVDVIMTSYGEEYIAAGDVNGDGYLNIMDVVQLVNLVLAW